MVQVVQQLTAQLLSALNDEGKVRSFDRFRALSTQSDTTLPLYRRHLVSGHRRSDRRRRDRQT